MEQAAGTPIDATKLPLQVLNEQKQQAEQDLNFINDSLNTLKVVYTKFMESKKSIQKVKDMREAKSKSTLLVPLTDSMYLPGSVFEEEKLLINIGTGYYLHLGPDKAIDYLQRRCAYLTEQIEMIQKILNEKSFTRNFLANVIQEKIHSQVNSQLAQEPVSNGQQ